MDPGPAAESGGDAHASSVDADGASAQATVAFNATARAAGEAVAKVASLAFYVVMARRLGHAQYGAFVFALALTGTLMIAAGFGTDDLVARRVARDYGRAGRDLANVTTLKAVTGAALLVIAIGVVFLGGYPPATKLATLIVGLGAAAEVMAKSWHSIFQANQRLELVSACLILQRTVTAIAGIAVLLAGGGLIGAAAVYLAGALAGLVAAEASLRRWTPVTRPRPTSAGGWELLRDGVPIGVAGLLFIVILRTDVLLLSFLDSNAEVGVYAAAYRLIEGTQFVAWSFNAAMLPWLARTRGPALARGYGLGLKLQASLLLAVALLAAAFARPIVHLLYGSGYDGAITPLALLAPTIVLYGLQSLSGTVLIARDAAGAFARIAGVVAVQNVACNAVLIPLAGADGAAVSAVSSSALMAALTIRQARRRAGGLEVGRTFGGPLAAGAALLAVALLAPLPAVPAGALALAAYALVLGAIELGLHGSDVDVYLRALPESVGRRLSGAASRFRRGRAAA